MSFALITFINFPSQNNEALTSSVINAPLRRPFPNLIQSRFVQLCGCCWLGWSGNEKMKITKNFFLAKLRFKSLLNWAELTSCDCMLMAKFIDVPGWRNAISAANKQQGKKKDTSALASGMQFNPRGLCSTRCSQAFNLLKYRLTKRRFAFARRRYRARRFTSSSVCTAEDGEAAREILKFSSRGERGQNCWYFMFYRFLSWNMRYNYRHTSHRIDTRQNVYRRCFMFIWNTQRDGTKPERERFLRFFSGIFQAIFWSFDVSELLSRFIIY